MSDRPYDCELEYLESTGTQYIDTFLVPNTNLTLTATFGITINSNFDDSGSIFISGRSTTSINVLSIMIRKKNLIYVDSVDGRKNMSVSPNITSTGTYTISLGTTTATLSGDSTGSVEFNGANASGSNSILIFRDRAVGYARTNIKLYSLKIWNSGSLVLDMTPVLKDGVGYMYDKVSRTLFGNAGTGSFVLGPRVGPMFEPPSHVRRLEYLESTGTQYVDTGILGGSDLVAKARVYWPYQNQTQGIVFGSLYKPQGSASIRYMLQRHTTYGGFYTDTNITPATIGVGSGWYDVQLNAPGGFVSVNNTVVSKTVASYSMSKPTMYLFARHVINEDISSDGGVDNISVAGVRISSFSLERNSVPVRDFVPVMEDGVGYLFDRVSGRMFGNSGTGSFVLGPDVREGVVPTRLNPFGVGRRQEEIRRVEYIEATGTQWIDTEVYADDTTKMTVRGTFFNEYSDGNVSTRLGSRLAIATSAFDALYISTGNFRIDLGTGSGTAAQWATQVNKILTEITIDAGTKAASLKAIDGTTASHTYDSSMTFADAPSLTLFCFTSGTDRLPGFHMRISSCQFWQSGTLIRDFVPVAIGSTGYLLDRVSGRLFGNAGTGSFVVGPDASHPAG